MGLFLFVSQVCLLTVTANGYVLFAANLEDFRNLAKKFVPDKLAGKLTEIVSESSLQYRQQKDVKEDDKYSDDGKTQRGRGGIDGRYDYEKRPERNGLDQMLQSVKDSFDVLPFKNKRPLDVNDRITDNRNVQRKPVKNGYDRERQQEREYDPIDLSTTFTSKDKRYRTVQRLPSSKRWYDQAPSYLPTKDDTFERLRLTTPKSIYEEHVRKGYPQISRDTVKERKKISTRYIPIIEREMKERDKRRSTVKESAVQLQEFEYENPKVTKKKEMLINGRNVKHGRIKKQEAKGNSDMIFETVLLNKKKGDYEELPEKDEEYFSEEANKPTTISKNRPKLNKKIGRENPNQRDIFKNEETTLRISKMKPLGKRPQVIQAETEPFAENEAEEDEEPKLEEVKARTESLLFNSKEQNVITNPHVMKGTGIPTRERYKMSTPDYYKKLPRIVEKYDFNEPLPEADREPEKIDDRLAQQPARVNMKMKQQRQTSPGEEKSRQFKSILEGLGFAL